MFEDKDLKLLTRLGFTSSQAKVYLGLVYLGQSCVHNLLKVAQIDRGETYRVISRLEKQGFVHRIIVNPTEFKAVPVSDLLSVLLLRRKTEVCELEQDIKRFQKKKIENVGTSKEEYMLLASKPEMILDSIRHASSPERPVDVVSRLCGSRKSTRVLEDILWNFIESGAKVRFIVDAPVEDIFVTKLLKELESHPNFTLMYTTNSAIVPVVIIGDTEVWINTSERFIFLEGTHLLSNNPRLVRLAQGYFNHLLSTSISVKLPMI
ncbi:MAG: helix-turn-helix domain-containing protein [Candidatus Bathyarchaeota archaeon]|nr:helix-turn-helix domain-containing protein [Candidatus Bathyarchaeota archaeon]